MSFIELILKEIEQQQTDEPRRDPMEFCTAAAEVIQRPENKSELATIYWALANLVACLQERNAQLTRAEWASIAKLANYLHDINDKIDPELARKFNWRRDCDCEGCRDESAKH